MEKNEQALTKETIKGSAPHFERNRSLTNRVQEHAEGQLTESVRKAFGVDLKDKEFKFEDPFFSWKGFRESAYKLASKKLQEANAENTFSQLLRGGINMIANDWYRLVETNHEMVGATTFSTKAVEPYAPMNRGGLPRRVQASQPFPRTRVAGLDIQIANEKFGAIVDFERELFDDDQTGQIAQRARDIGENMRIIEDAWFFQRFIGTAGSYGGDPIPASQTYGANVWVTSASPFTGGGYNRPTSYGIFTPQLVENGDVALMNQLDLLGNKMLVNPNTLLVGTNNKFSARIMLNSEWYPANVTTKVAGGTQDTTLGTSFARNPLDGLYNLVVSRFMPAKAWALGEGGKGIVFQRRDAMEMIQENPQSGMAFTQDVYAFRSRARWEPDWIDPRFWWLGNDGSV